MDPELDELRREFLLEAGAKVDEIEKILDHPPSDSSPMDRMSYLAHQLKGSGGSYGYTIISTEAAHLEELIEQSPTLPISDRIDEFRGRLGAIRTEIGKQLEELGGH